MPIYDQTYRSYEGQVQHRFRWWTIVKQEFRVLFTLRAFVVLLILGYFHFILRVLQVVTFDMVSSNPTNPMVMMMREVAMLMVDPKMFYDFIRIQAPVAFVACLFAGSGLICDDFRNNLMEVYFSKPISWRDYVLGKMMTLFTIGFALTALPALLLLLLHNLMAPSWKTFYDVYWVAPAILGFSAAVVVPAAIGVLASSALIRSQRFASISIFMILVGDSVMAGILADALHKNNYLLLAFPAAIDQFGGILFGQKRLLFELPWYWSGSFIAIVSLAALWVVCRVVRRAEVAV